MFKFSRRTLIHLFQNSRTAAATVFSRAHYSLVADERRCVHLLDERVVVAAHSSTHSVLTLLAAVVQAVLHHKVHRRSSVKVRGQVLKVVQHIGVLERQFNSKLHFDLRGGAELQIQSQFKPISAVINAE